MSVREIMQWELEQLDMLKKLAKRMDWEEDHVHYKKRLKATTHEGAMALDRVKNGGGGAAEAAKVKLTWTVVDAHVGEKHSWESAYPAMMQIMNSTKWKRGPDCPQSQVGKMPARRKVLHEDGETYRVRFIMNVAGDFTMQQGHPIAPTEEGEEGEEGESGEEGEEGEEDAEVAKEEAEKEAAAKAAKKEAAKAAKAAKAAEAEVEKDAKAAEKGKTKKVEEEVEQPPAAANKRSRKAVTRG